MPDIPVPFFLKVKNGELLQVRQKTSTRTSYKMSVSVLLGSLSDLA